MSNRNRPSSLFGPNEQGLVDTFIGTAYDVVKEVYDNLDNLKLISDAINNIDETISEAIEIKMDEYIPELELKLNQNIKDLEDTKESIEKSLKDLNSKLIKDQIDNFDTYNQQLELKAQGIFKDLDSLIELSNKILKSINESEALALNNINSAKLKALNDIELKINDFNVYVDNLKIELNLHLKSILDLESRIELMYKSMVAMGSINYYTSISEAANKEDINNVFGIINVDNNKLSLYKLDSKDPIKTTLLIDNLFSEYDLNKIKVALGDELYLDGSKYLNLLNALNEFNLRPDLKLLAQKNIGIFDLNTKVNNINKSIFDTLLLDFFNFVDEEGNIIFSIKENSFGTEYVNLTNSNTHESDLTIVDEEGTILFSLNSDGTNIEDLLIKKINSKDNNLLIVDKNLEVINDLTNPLFGVDDFVKKEIDKAIINNYVSPINSNIYFGKNLPVLQDKQVNIFCHDSLSFRDSNFNTNLVFTYDPIINTKVRSSNLELTIVPDESESFLFRVYDHKEPGKHKTIEVFSPTIYKNKGEKKKINILLLGDSISNRQGTFLMDQILKDYGYEPNWVGTLNGSASPTNAGDDTGFLNESKEGWETGDYTFRVTDRALPLAVGDEYKYSKMSKAEKWNINPFIRLPNESDKDEDIVNGYVLDFNFYINRFKAFFPNMVEPDIILFGLGTNDVRDRREENIYNDVLFNDSIFLTKLRSQWKNTKIIRFVPNTSRNSVRNNLWNTKYTKVFDAIIQSDKVRKDKLSYIAPTWCLTNSLSGYKDKGNTSSNSLLVDTSFTDAVHLYDSSRLSLFETLSAYTIAAFENKLK